MSHVMRVCVVSVGTLAALFSSGNVAAEEVQAAVIAAAPMLSAPKAVECVMEPEAAVVSANPMGVKALDLKALAKRRGAADVYNDMQLKGVVANNQAVNVATGNNAITDGSFSGAAGVPMVVQNSGNNVLIQNATIVNVQVK